jgi:hypothetical protein
MSKLTALSFLTIVSTALPVNAEDDLVEMGKAVFSERQDCHVVGGNVTTPNPHLTLTTCLLENPVS